MGYSHNWRVPLKDTPEVVAGYADALKAVQKIMKRNGYKLDAEKLKEGVIWLDGEYETFVVHRSVEASGRGGDEEEAAFDFCKTGHELYDLPVCESLLALLWHVPGFTIGSDGLFLAFDYDEKGGLLGGMDGTWVKAFRNVEKHYGMKFDLTVERRPCSFRGAADNPAYYRKITVTKAGSGAQAAV
jgi:hypothetical protein